MSSATESYDDTCPDFTVRHIGPSPTEQEEMLSVLGYSSLDQLSRAALPSSILRTTPLALPPPSTEAEVSSCIEGLLAQNHPKKTYRGRGFVPSVLPAVIGRNILENPGWYTQYTPYQAEIAQGRLEALFNFQTMVASLTGLPIANASLLDEATAAAEAMMMARQIAERKSGSFFVEASCHPQILAVLRTRAKSLGITLEVGTFESFAPETTEAFGLLVQLPQSDGRLRDPRALFARCAERGVVVVVASCLLACAALVPPGELGADIAIGSTQRFGLPLGFGGPHAAFLATREQHKRLVPGRIVGRSHDNTGRPAFRLALQTREQHIRRERASSNICTAQVLPAVIASFYAIYHGPDGLSRMARRIAGLTALLADGLERLGYVPLYREFFDTLSIPVPTEKRAPILARAEAALLELGDDTEGVLRITLGETTTEADLEQLLVVFADQDTERLSLTKLAASRQGAIPLALRRTSGFLEAPVFHRYRNEHELLRYMKALESRDLSLTTSMIPLGSCTMKHNPAAAMLPLTSPQLSRLHPYTAPENARGFLAIARDLEQWLAEITGMDAVSLQPNSGAQGEYAGLLTISAYHEERGEPQRRVCLIPVSAHGTNPASASLAGLRVVTVNCDREGNIDLNDLRVKAERHASELACAMVTYPSTHGVFEERIVEVGEIVHQHGGLVYLDGANLNAQVGLARPGDYGADVCHINLHKTFAIPHGGGGPGSGPIAVKKPLSHLLPTHPCEKPEAHRVGAVSASPFGSGSILVISWMYMRLLGAEGLRHATEVALLNANYMAHRLKPHYPILFSGPNGLCAHEFIIDPRAFKKTCGIEVDDIAKRLMDYGFHAPTMSFPVAGTLMIEPTESESKEELDRFCDALLQIRAEIAAIEARVADPNDNPLKNAPHTLATVTSSNWPHAYTREEAAFPNRGARLTKFWPAVGRVDNAAGDRCLVCAVPPDEASTSVGSA